MCWILSLDYAKLLKFLNSRKYKWCKVSRTQTVYSQNSPGVSSSSLRLLLYSVLILLITWCPEKNSSVILLTHHPIRGQFWCHVICFDQSQASLPWESAGWPSWFPVRKSWRSRSCDDPPPQAWRCRGHSPVKIKV